MHGARYNEPWTDARVALLREHWAAGLSASQVARKLGGFYACRDGGRSAVIGKVHRLGLPYRTPNGKPNESVRARLRPKKKRATINFIPNDVLRRTKPDLLRTELALIAALPPAFPWMTLAEVKAGQCKYMNGDPKTDATICGRATGGDDAVWCSQHRKLVYTPSKPRSRVRTVESDELRRQLKQQRWEAGVAA